jgi:hypothetical protein
MFGLGLKERSAEALRRGTKAVVDGGFFEQSEVEKFGLNESASAFLYSEALAHQIYALGLIYGSSLVGKNRWATPAFFFQNVGEVLVEEEHAQGLPPGALSKVLLNRFMDFEGLPARDRQAGKHFDQSASMVAQRDASADIEKISETLESCSSTFFNQAKKVFGL